VVRPASWLVALSLCGVSLPGWSQTAVGIEARVANTSLLIDLDVGPPPPTISASGLFSDVAGQIPSPGLIPYSVNSPLWSDGAYKTRLLALPGITQIEFSRDGNWGFPANTVLVKNFHLDTIRDDPGSRRIVETRFLVKVGDSEEWRGFSYRWNDAGTDAELLPSGWTERYTIVDPEAPDGETHVDYIFPAPEDCGRCHTFGAGQILGPRTAQLNGAHDYGGVVAHQLRTLNHIGVFSDDIGDDYTGFPRWENPEAETESLAGRARSYLASNCSHCHRPGGLRRTEIDLRYDTDLAQTGTVDVPSQLDDLGRINSRIISPGDAGNSVLPLRMMALDNRRMPPLASGIVDVRGSELLSRWIEALGPPTAVSDDEAAPDAFVLRSIYPNPFNSTVTIDFSLGEASRVKLAIYDAAGRRVRRLVSAVRPSGYHRVFWDGRDEAGALTASGVYLIRLQTGSDTRSRKLTLLR